MLASLALLLGFLSFAMGDSEPRPPTQLASLALLLGFLSFAMGDSEPHTPTALQQLFGHIKATRNHNFLWLTVRKWNVTVRYRHAGFMSRLSVAAEMTQELYDAPHRRAVLPRDGDYPVYGGDFAPGLPHGCAPVLAYCGRPQLSIPSFALGKWPEVRLVPFNQFYAETARMADDGLFLQRRPQLFWRGNVNTNPLRRQLVKQYASHPDFDIADIYVHDDGHPKYASIPDHAHYRYVLDAPANGFSGRLSRLLLLGSVVFIVDRPLQHQEYWHQDFMPWEHFVPVKADASDLLPNLALLLGNDTLAVSIAQAGHRRAREVFVRPRRDAHFAAVLANYTQAYGTLGPRPSSCPNCTAESRDSA